MIDKIICLNLEHRTDRLKRIQDTIPSYLPKVEVFKAFTPRTCYVPPSWPHLPGYYATTYGHIKILESLMLSKNWNCCLILEDDAEFLDVCYYYESLNELVKHINEHRPDWLGIFLGYHLQRPMTRITNMFSLNNGCTQSHAYIINLSGARRLFDHLWVKQFQVVDWAYSDLMNEDKAFFSPNEQYITTAEGFSENMGIWKRRGT